MLSLIVAYANNHVIGKDNKLPWHLKDDMVWFHEHIKGKNLIMGRKTYQSLPKRLDCNKYIILTGNKYFNTDNKGDIVLHTVDDIMNYIKSDRGKEYVVIGGGEIYRQFIPYVNRMYITEINKEFNGDTYFPYYDKSEWILKDNIEILGTPIDHRFLTYIRKQA